MSFSAQEQREWAHLHTFRESISDFPEGNIPLERKGASPDFRVVSHRRVVGIEHTEVYREAGEKGIPPQARETYITRITRRARQLYRTEENPPVSVWPSFSTNAHLGKHNVEALAKKLASIVESNIPAENCSTRIDQTWCQSDPLPRQLYSIQIMRYSGLDDQLWFPPMSGMIPRVPTEYVRNRIQSKSEKIDEYRVRCDHLWLLVVVDGSRPSTFFDIKGEALKTTYVSSFDRTYLLDYQNREVFELKTKSPESQR